MSAKKTAKKIPALPAPKFSMGRSNSANLRHWFAGVIGQEAVKRKLGFHLGSHLENGAPLPNYLFEGSQGDGKSFLARRFARNFPDPSDKTRRHKEFIAVDGEKLKNLTVFFEDLCIKFADGKKYVTIFIDEFHGVKGGVQNAMLTVTEPNDSGITRYTFNDVTYTFDTRRVTWLLATTESNKVAKPLRDRFRGIQIQPYNASELAEIIEMKIDGRVKFEAGMLPALAGYVRRNARKADEIAKDVLALGVNTFSQEHLNFLVNELDLYPFGLTKDEIRLLTMLSKDGSLRLGALASRFGKPPKAVQLEIEPYLISLGFLEIETVRRITAKGRTFLEETLRKK